ncbi:dynein axonemal intermediate chain 7, partial [Chanos chanos]|uniref:Dynein axonemal intermediate chain 7 n=1 Tax=Chanos chanos TaxID=29144 RepID=A0A6J2W2A2_CHACN
TKSAKRKGSKINKNEKERLQKEEDEQRRKEEEEAQLVAEREEQERMEKEQREQEEQQRLELKDQERREDELNELRRLLEENQAAVNSWEEATRVKAKWDRYMRCDGSPDPSVQPEINTFISLWMDDPEVEIKPILKQCVLALQLIDELDDLLTDQPSVPDAQRYQETLLSLQNLIHSKHNQATEELLKWAKAHSDTETGNMQMVIQDENITLCLWANLKKNPRFKGYQFEEVGLGFKLPKQLAVSDIAVRILHTRYDHLSHLSRQTLSQSKSSMRDCEDRTSVTETSETDGGEMGGEIEVEKEGRESNLQVEEESTHSEGRKSAVSVSSRKEERKSSVGKNEEGGESQIETMVTATASEEETGEGESVHSAAEPEFDSSADLHIVDLQQYIPLGGVFYFDVFWLPPQSQTINGWEIRELLETGLQIFPYPTDPSGMNSASAKLDEINTVSSQPAGVTVTLPECVLFLEEPLVAHWDSDGQHWRTDNISDISYDASARSVSFGMKEFCAFTLLQEAHANMPFQSWELRPLGKDSALFTITGALIELSITVQDNQCMLQTEHRSELAHITGKWMSLSAIQKAMRSAGLNVFVNEHSEKYVSVNAKDPLIEHAVYEQMALLSTAVAFTWSQWNAQCAQEHLVLQACEHMEAGPVAEEAWSVYLLGAQRNQRLRMKERSESFSPELAPGSEFHSTFFHLLKDDMSAEAQNRVRQAHHLYTDTMQRLLCATRVLIYS